MSLKNEMLIDLGIAKIYPHDDREPPPTAEL